jgi:hypothetical protein
VAFIAFDIYRDIIKFNIQGWMHDSDSAEDSVIKPKPIWESYLPKSEKKKRRLEKKKQGNLFRTYGTRVIPV